MKKYYLVGRIGTMEALMEIPETTSFIGLQVENMPSPNRPHALQRIKNLAESFPEESFTILEVYSNRDIEGVRAAVEPVADVITQPETPDPNQEGLDDGTPSLDYRSLFDVCYQTIDKANIRYPHDFRSSPQFISETVHTHFDNWVTSIKQLALNQGFELEDNTIRGFLLTLLIEILEKRMLIQITSFAEAKTRFYADLDRAQKGQETADIDALRNISLTAFLKAKGAVAYSTYGDQETADSVLTTIHNTAVAIVSGHDYSNIKNQQNEPKENEKN